MARKGGWDNEATVALFVRYFERLTLAIGDEITAAFTLNEPNLTALLAGLNSRSNLRAASARPITSARGSRPASATRTTPAASHVPTGTFPVGWTLASPWLEAVDGGEATAEAVDAQVATSLARGVLRGRHRRRADLHARAVDSSGRIGAPEGSALTQTGWEVYPEALAVRRAAAVTGRPVWVTENGIATDDDELRIDCTRRALQGVEECIRDDVDVQAYFHWSLLDNFEWTLGYPANFGLVVVDRETLELRPKPSLHWYGDRVRSYLR